MRKLFSFRSSTSSNGTSDPVPPPAPPDKEKVYWDAPFGAENTRECSKSLKQIPDSENSASRSVLRRSLSFSSTYRGSPTNSNVPSQSSDFVSGCRSLTPERQFKPKRRGGPATRRPFEVEKLASSCSSKNSNDLSGNSYGSPPVPPELDSARLMHVSNKVHDLYIDGEQHQQRNLRSKHNSLRNTTSNGVPNCSRPPRGYPTAPASPTDIRKEKVRSYSFRDIREPQPRKEYLPESPQKLARNVVERLSQVFPQKPRSRSRDLQPDTPTTVEDIFEDLEPNPYPNTDIFIQKNNIIDSPFRTKSSCSEEEIRDFQNRRQYVGEAPVATFLSQTDEDEDMLRMRGEEAQERVMRISEEIEQDNLIRGSDFSISELFQTLRSINEEQRDLAVEVSTQIQCRISERESAREALRGAKLDFESQTRKLEKEKNELQLGLEKELDRRSSEWSFKLEKYQLEEQRLRERVREMAEQNVSLQREVSSLSGREVENEKKMSYSELQLKELMAKLEESREENKGLHKSLSELKEQFTGVETERDCIRTSHKEKDKENKELQKTVARLQRTCSEQEKTITGLRQVLGEEVGRKESHGYDGDNGKLELARLTGVEQVLRAEVKSLRLEVETVRHENINLLDRLQSCGRDGVFSCFRLDQQLHDRVSCLQTQGLSLFRESSELCEKLLRYIKGSTNQITTHVKEICKNEFDGYFIVEANTKVQNFRRGIEALTKSLQTISSMLDEKSKRFGLESHSACSESDRSGKRRGALEDDVAMKLMEESLLTSLLREKMFSKELEVERLQAEVATAARGHDILRCEVQGALDSLTSASHRMKDLELQMLKKDDNIHQLRVELQECKKELAIMKGVLPKLSEERDVMWDEVKQYSEKNMLLNSEVNMLRKKIETLEEDLHIKEGEITILKDSIDNKPFDILYNPKSMQEFRLD